MSCRPCGSSASRSSARGGAASVVVTGEVPPVERLRGRFPSTFSTPVPARLLNLCAPTYVCGTSPHEATGVMAIQPGPVATLAHHVRGHPHQSAEEALQPPTARGERKRGPGRREGELRSLDGAPQAVPRPARPLAAAAPRPPRHVRRRPALRGLDQPRGRRREDAARCTAPVPEAVATGGPVLRHQRGPGEVRRRCPPAPSRSPSTAAPTPSGRRACSTCCASTRRTPPSSCTAPRRPATRSWCGGSAPRAMRSARTPTPAPTWAPSSPVRSAAGTVAHPDGAGGHRGHPHQAAAAAADHHGGHAVRRRVDRRRSAPPRTGYLLVAADRTSRKPSQGVVRQFSQTDLGYQEAEEAAQQPERRQVHHRLGRARAAPAHTTGVHRRAAGRARA